MWYAPGSKCKRGHIAKRRTSNGMCSMCEQEPEYRARKTAIATAWLDVKPENRDRHNAIVLARQKRLRADDPETVRARDREYNANLSPPLKAKRSKRLKNWRDANQEHVAAYGNAYTKAWRKANPSLARMKGRLASQRRRSRELNAEGPPVTNKLVEELFAAQNGICYIPGCGADISQKFEIDHKTSLYRGGTNWPDNIALACEYCNSQKHTMSVEEFVARRAKRRAA